jgi:pyruvate/2-oxoglutarate dehydrogenase complex dihydrolipoamide dehydrogenase (E3) component
MGAASFDAIVIGTGQAGPAMADRLARAGMRFAGPHAVEKGETQGFIKIMVDADTREILGAAILGVGGDEVVHTILKTMYARQPYTTPKHAMHIHPTVAELVPTVLGDLKPA